MPSFDWDTHILAQRLLDRPSKTMTMLSGVIVMTEGQEPSRTTHDFARCLLSAPRQMVTFVTIDRCSAQLTPYRSEVDHEGP